MKALPADTAPATTRGRALLFLLAAFILPLAGGCAYPQPLHTYEYIIQYDRMSDEYEPLLSLVYVPEGVKLSLYRDLLIGHIALGGLHVEEPDVAEHYATLFRALLQREMRKTDCFEFVTLDEHYSDGDPAIRLDAKITMFDFGSGACRFFGWSTCWLQAEAASDFQVEGRITDAATGDLLMEFVDRRRHMGNTPWGPNFKTFDDEFVMKQTMKETALCLSKVVAMAGDGLPEEPVGD